MRVTQTLLSVFHVEMGFIGHSSYRVWLFSYSNPRKPNTEGETGAEHDLQVNS